MLKNTVIRVKDKNGRMLQIGKVDGDTFSAFERDEKKHLFRGGAATLAEAKERKRAAWGLDLAAMERLFDQYNVRFVEVPTTDGVRYRTTMDMLLGPKSFVKEYGGHRPQVMLPLHYWTVVKNG